MYWWIVYVMFWNSGFEDAPCTSFLVQLELEGALSSRFFWVAPHVNCFQRPLKHSLVDSLENIRLLTLKRIGNCFPKQFLLLLVHRHSPDWPVPETLWRVFFTPRVARHQAQWSRLRRNCWSRLCHRRAFIWSRILTSFWHGALLSNPIVRKKITDMATREHRETHNVEQTKKMIPFVTWKASLS